MIIILVYLQVEEASPSNLHLQIEGFYAQQRSLHLCVRRKKAQRKQRY